MSEQELILYDADMGTDDAWGLFMLLKAEKKYNFKLLGVTIVNGNTIVKNGIENALRVLSSANRLDIPVYKGAEEPMVKQSEVIQHYHGANGFGDVKFTSTPDLSLVRDENAVNYIYRIVKENPKKVTLICVGPLTNIALAIKTYSDFKGLVKEIFIMGGNYTATGNCAFGCAEFNFCTDPEAAFVVLNKPMCKVTILPWEACMERSIDISMDYRFNDIGNIKSYVTDLMNPVDTAIFKSKHKSKWNPCDAILVAVFLEKDKMIKNSERFFATVELNGECTRGQVAIHHLTVSENEFNVTMIELIDSNVCKNMLLWTASP